MKSKIHGLEYKVKRYTKYDETMLDDLIAMLAANIEDSYLMADVPYTGQKCMDMAFELVKVLWQNPRKSVMGISFHTDF